MSMVWPIERCTREYKQLTGRDAAEDGRFPYLEGVFAWRSERFRYDITSGLRRALKTGRPLRGRNEETEAKWYAQFKRAEPVFAAHAELHDRYADGLSALAQVESQPFRALVGAHTALGEFERVLQQMPNAIDAAVYFFVFGAKARWEHKGWGTPTPMELAYLAGATGFEEFSGRDTTRERWKSRISKWRKRSVNDDFSFRAAADAELDGTDCFILPPSSTVSAIPKLRIELPLDETG